MLLCCVSDQRRTWLWWSVPMIPWTQPPRKIPTLSLLVCLCWRSGSLSRWDIWCMHVWKWVCPEAQKDKEECKIFFLQLDCFLSSSPHPQWSSIWRHTHKIFTFTHTHAIRLAYIHTQFQVQSHPDPISGDCVAAVMTAFRASHWHRSEIWDSYSGPTSFPLQGNQRGLLPNHTHLYRDTHTGAQIQNKMHK